MRIYLDGTDSMRAGEHARQAAVGGDRGGSQPAAQEHRTGTGRSRLYCRRPGAADPAYGRHQPADGLAQAAAL